MFQPITFKQLKSLTSCDALICLGGLEVTHQAAVQEVPVSIPGSDKAFKYLKVPDTGLDFAKYW